PAPFGKAYDATDIETGEVLKYPAGHAKAGRALFKRRFIPARLSDNPYLAEQGDYEAMLLSLPEQQRRQLLDGDWDIKEGAAFTEFDRSIHRNGQQNQQQYHRKRHQRNRRSFEAIKEIAFAEAAQQTLLPAHQF
ncbi:MAG: hypothetical protein EBW65_10815, partial [Gammaproteobacteria bacterium]|nr:hypothetical protein [Gammaproteobacteria bacterium]